MAASRSSERGRARRTSRLNPGISEIASRRAAGEDFGASFLELQDLVSKSCVRQVEWQAKVVAGIRVTLEFAAAHPGKARALTLDARRPAFGDRNPEQVAIAYFVDRFREVAPAKQRLPVSTDQALVEAVATMIRGHLLGGTEERLPDAAPDLVYLALMPYLGLAEVQRWTELAARAGS